MVSAGTYSTVSNLISTWNSEPREERQPGSLVPRSEQALGNVCTPVRRMEARGRVCETALARPTVNVD